MNYFKIKTAYNEFINIDSISDLEKAQYAFLTDGKVIFSNGKLCRGKDIMGISEDYHKEMNWNDSHKIDEDDLNQLKQKGVIQKYNGLIARAKETVQYLIETNQANLVGKGFDLLSLNSGNKIDTSSLLDKFKI